MEIIPNVHRVPGLSGANVYLLIDRELTLVDAGMPGQTDAILSYIEGLGRAAGDLARIVVTHDHLDHVGSLASLRQETSAQVIAHKAEAPLISGEQTHPPPRSVLMRLLALLAPIMPRADPAPVDLTAEDGDQLNLLGGATVVHVPGHTPGSIALHLPDEGLLFCGDAIDCRGKQPGPPIKAFTQDMDLAMDSIRRMADLDFDVLCPGHGTAIAGGADKQIRAMVQDWA
jgi:glyoxylase-like metal-dependent hydrolase (beta-lactamase superfamily II)